MGSMQELQRTLAKEPKLALGVLVGSRATGTAMAHSDWDIAIQWQPGLPWLEVLKLTEALRLELAKALNVAPDQVDLIDLPRASLAMRCEVAEKGIPVLGQDSLTWHHFLQRTWRELEDYAWEGAHAA